MKFEIKKNKRTGNFYYEITNGKKGNSRKVIMFSEKRTRKHDLQRSIDSVKRFSSNPDNFVINERFNTFQLRANNGTVLAMSKPFGTSRKAKNALTKMSKTLTCMEVIDTTTK